MSKHLKKAASGHLLKSAGGHLVNDCGGPCTNCDGTQPAATVTVTGCSISLCTGAQGTYTYQDFVDHDQSCSWRWSKDAGGGNRYDLFIYYCKSSGAWCAHIDYYIPSEGGHYRLFGGDADDCPCVSGVTDVSEDLSCQGGNVTGEFSLAGTQATCPNCTATVSVG